MNPNNSMPPPMSQGPQNKELLACLLLLLWLDWRTLWGKTDSLKVQEKVNLDKKCYLCLGWSRRRKWRKCFIWLPGISHGLFWTLCVVVKAREDSECVGRRSSVKKLHVWRGEGCCHFCCGELCLCIYNYVCLYRRSHSYDWDRDFCSVCPDWATVDQKWRLPVTSSQIFKCLDLSDC